MPELSTVYKLNWPEEGFAALLSVIFYILMHSHADGI